MKKHNESKQNRKKGNSTSQLSKLPPVNNNNNQKKKLSFPDNFNFNGSTYQDQGLVGLIHQYFIKHDFLDALQSFQKDCSKGFKTTNKVQNQIRDQIIHAFDTGQRQTFMTRFSQYVPMSLRAKDQQTMRIEFYIQIYFFVFSIHPQLGKKKTIDLNSKQGFINYLESRGSQLAKDSQFLQFYALAYLPKPQQHPNFKTIFTKQWISQLRQRVIYFLEKLYPAGRKPLLINIYDKFIQRNLQIERDSRVLQHQEPREQIEQEIEMDNRSLERSRGNQDMEIQMLEKKIQQLQQDKNELVKLIQGSNKKYQSLQNTYKDFVQIARQNLIQSQMKWFQITQQFFAIASDLLNCSKKLHQGIPLQDPSIIQHTAKKLSKYESFINMNVQDLLSDNVDFSMFERTQHDISTDLVRRNTDYKPVQLIQLNFTKINAILTSVSSQQIDQKSFLMQALRWRISKTRGLINKRQAVMSYILYDILGLKRNGQTFAQLIKSQNSTLVIQVSKFLSVFAKDYYARQYMVSQNCMKNCLQVLMNQNTDNKAQEYLVMTLQQISIRAKAQILMIQSGLIKWLVNKMDKQRQQMQVYLMSYMSTLLLNLLLRKQGLDKSQQIKDQILKTLINLMQYQATQVRSYAHGALYPLLSRKIFRDKAKQYGMQQNIKYLKNNNPPADILTQLVYLQQRLQLTQDPKDDQQQDQQDNDVDEIAPDQQYDQDIGQNQISGPLQGQQLFMKKYSLTGPDSITQMNAIRQQVHNSLKKKSVFGRNSFYQRSSANTPIMGKLRRNISNNNSVYSNKSSNRVLKSQMRNRDYNGNQNIDGNQQSVTRQGNYRLDTVHQNNSEVSMKQLMQQRGNINNLNNNQGDLFIASQHKLQQSRDRNMQQSDGKDRDRAQTPNLYRKPQQQQQNLNNQNKEGNQINNNNADNENNYKNQQNPTLQQKQTRNQHYYQKNKDYKDAFKTRSKLVRTPPQK